MAEAKMREIAGEAAEKFGVYAVAMEHRLGLVPVKEASVIIAVSSPHRRNALDACAFCIDELKARVPIWKKEVYQGEDGNWKQNKEWAGALPTKAEGTGGDETQERKE
uniref:Molybdopterin synthase catalytic subunit n=1 Tax=Pinguiococcus pyrenoidosus TaxID=172671 RepID=A0A7R9YFH2_9STRA|mmetsp:Transcript_8342/g.31411  ORF Transcript_8342/g.31411 Transcript_8342/m.31411 type:complete len:108 (+) Transcript_8342:311-634(+)